MSLSVVFVLILGLLCLNGVAVGEEDTKSTTSTNNHEGEALMMDIKTFFNNEAVPQKLKVRHLCKCVRATYINPQTINTASLKLCVVERNKHCFISGIMSFLSVVGCIQRRHGCACTCRFSWRLSLSSQGFAWWSRLL